MGALSDSIGGGGGITIEEADGSPSVSATTVKFPNGSLTINGTTVSVDEYPAPLGVNGPNLATYAPYLRAGYTFNDASGSLTDSVGVPHNMAAAGGSGTYLQAGKNSTAIKFNSTTHFKRPPQGFSPGSSEFTLNWWVNITDVGATNRLLYWTKEGSTSRVGVYIGFSQLRFQEDYSGPTSIGVTAPLANTWQMVTYQRVKDGGSYYNRVFLNGVQEINVLAILNDFEDRSLYLGRDYYASIVYAPNLTGDELLYYTGPDGYGALSAAAILELYNSGTGVFLDTVGAPSGLGFSHADLVGFNQYLHDYWKFEETGSPLIDSISNNSLAATGSPTFSATGKNGNCVELNVASLDSLSRSGTFTHSASQEYSMSYWVYVNSSPAALGVFHEFYYNSYAQERVGLTPTNTISMLRRWSSGYSHQNFTSTTTLAASTWHHISIVKTQIGALYQWSLYINGAFEGSDTADANSRAMNTAGATFTLGADHSLTTYNFDGKIDELAYWRGTALDSAAVTALYNAGAGRFLESV